MTKPRNKRTAAKMQGASSAALQAVTPPRGISTMLERLILLDYPTAFSSWLSTYSVSVIELGTMVSVSRDMNVLAKRDEY